MSMQREILEERHTTTYVNSIPISRSEVRLHQDLKAGPKFSTICTEG